MIRLVASALVATCFAIPSVAANPDPNPAALAPSPEQVAKARDLVRRLGSAVYREREDATRELYRMGRFALPALTEAVAGAADPEVQVRVELLRPRSEALDLQARLDAFLADAEGKYDHDLPGWDKFRTIAGPTPDARELFTQFWKAKPNVDLLVATRGPADELVKRVAARRTELYNQQYQPNRNGSRVPPTVADLAALVFVEGVAGKITDRRFASAVSNLMSLPSARAALADEAKPAFRRLVVNWLDTRDDANELYTAMQLAKNLGLKDAPAARYAAKLLEAPGNGPGVYKMLALTALAQTGGKEHLPTLAKAMTDESAQVVAVANGPNGVQQVQVQVRDVALAMSLILTDQKPEDYGFELRARGGGDAVKYSYSTYRFADDKARDAAFARWKEYEAKHGAEGKK